MSDNLAMEEVYKRRKEHLMGKDIITVHVRSKWDTRGKEVSKAGSRWYLVPDIIISLCYSAFCEPMKLKCSEFVFMHEKADGNTQPQKIEPQDTPTTLGLVNNDWIVAYKREIIICPANLCLSEFDTLRELHEHSQEEHPGGINDAGEVLPTTPPTEAGGIKRGATFPKGGGAGHNNSFGEISSRACPFCGRVFQKDRGMRAVDNNIIT